MHREPSARTMYIHVYSFVRQAGDGRRHTRQAGQQTAQAVGSQGFQLTTGTQALGPAAAGAVSPCSGTTQRDNAAGQQRHSQRHTLPASSSPVRARARPGLVPPGRLAGWHQTHQTISLPGPANLGRECQCCISPFGQPTEAGTYLVGTSLPRY